MVCSRQFVVATLLLSGSSLGVVSASRLGKKESQANDRKLHVHSTGGINDYNTDTIESDSHGTYITSSPVCHASDVNDQTVNGCGSDDLYLDVCDPTVLPDTTFTQSACKCIDQATCEERGGSMMIDMETSVQLCIRNQNEVCQHSHPAYQTLHVMADLHADGSGVHYWGCQCIRTDRPMEPLITARTFNAPPNDDDSVIRFNKYDYSGSIPGGVFIKNFPNMTDAEKDSYENMADLGMNDYPISADLDLVERLRKSNAISVVTEMDYEIKHSVQDLISSVGGRPLHPTCDASSSFWDELEHVVRVNIYRRENPDSPSSDMEEEFPNSWQEKYIPSQWMDYTIKQVADAVHDEPPGYHQAQLIHKFLSSPEGLTPDYSIMPERSAVEFISAVVRLYETNTHFINYVSPHNFAAKWHAGRARPEEVVHAIVNEGIDTSIDCVPSDLRDLIMANYGPGSAADLTDSYWNDPGKYGPDGTTFTAYSEGSPRHPSWPAMHSAASNISFWLQVAFKLTLEQQCEAMLVDYAVSYARTVAGVHYTSDNIDGLNMGKEIIRRSIPDYLHHKFDADEDAARLKADLIASGFDWNDYYPGSDAFEELCGGVLPLEDSQSRTGLNWDYIDI